MTSESYYVLSDNQGFVGAFYTAEEASVVINKYYPIPFIVQRFEVAPGPTETVWVVIYRDIDAVAFVSNDRATAKRVKKIYDSVGLTYPDSIKYWEHPVGKISQTAESRLDSISRANSMYAGNLSLEELQARELEDYKKISNLSMSKGPIARVIKENQKIMIFDCVVPTSTSTHTAQL